MARPRRLPTPGGGGANAHSFIAPSPFPWSTSGMSVRLDVGTHPFVSVSVVVCVRFFASVLIFGYVLCSPFLFGVCLC